MRTFCFFLRDLGVLTFSPCKQRPKRNNTTRMHHVNTRLIYISVCVAWRLHIATVKQIRSVLCIRTKRPRGSILTDTNTDVHSVREHISTHTHTHTRTDTLVCDENKETLAPLAPPPITHAASTPSSQLSQLQKLYKYTRTLSHIHTHPHTPLFLLTPFPAHHGSLQLVPVCPLSAAACV